MGNHLAPNISFPRELQQNTYFVMSEKRKENLYSGQNKMSPKQIERYPFGFISWNRVNIPSNYSIILRITFHQVLNRGLLRCPHLQFPVQPHCASLPSSEKC